MSHCCLKWSTDFLSLVQGSLARPISRPDPASFLSPTSPHTLNSSNRKGLAVPGTCLTEFMFSWGAFIHSWISSEQALGSVSSRPGLPFSLLSSFFHSHLICHLLSETFFEPLELNDVPLFYILYIRDGGGGTGTCLISPTGLWGQG